MDIRFGLGLIAGEGTFTLNRREYGGKEKTYCSPQFQLSMKADEKELIENVKESFEDIGSLSVHDNIAVWHVTSKDDIETFRDIIAIHGDCMWRSSKKASSFETWKKIVEIHITGVSDDQDRVDMAALAKNEGLNAHEGGTDADWDSFLSEYENRNVYPNTDTK